MGMKIAVLGLGAMGSRMARVLLQAGNDVTIYSRKADVAKSLMAAGARYAATPHQAVQGMQVVLSMVADVQASRQIWLEGQGAALPGIGPGCIAIESSTLTVDWIRELDTAVTTAGAGFLEAPVVGTLPHAETGQLVALAGGPIEILERALPVLSPLAKKVLHIGSVGQGTAVKLAVNAFFAVQIAALSEFLGVAADAGIGINQAESILADLPVMSPSVTNALKQISANNFTPLFPIRLVAKDLKYMRSLAGQRSLKVPLAEAAFEVFTRANDEGLAGDNISGVAKMYLTAEVLGANALSDSRAAAK